MSVVVVLQVVSVFVVGFGVGVVQVISVVVVHVMSFGVV